MTPRTRAALPLLAVGVTLVFWASAFVAIRHLGDHVGPGELSLGRLVVGSLCLGALLDLAHRQFAIMYAATALVALFGLWIYWRGN